MLELRQTLLGIQRYSPKIVSLQFFILNPYTPLYCRTTITLNSDEIYGFNDQIKQEGVEVPTNFQSTDSR